MLGMTDLSQYSGVKNNQSITFNNKAMSDKDEVSWKTYIAALNEGQAMQECQTGPLLSKRRCRRSVRKTIGPAPLASVQKK